MAIDSTAIFILFASFFLLIIIRVPITFSLGLSTLFTVLYLKLPIMIVFQQMAKGVQSFSLIAIPFFILAGEIMGQGGISRKIVDFADILVGRFRGGLGQVNILASMFFGGISGSAIADVSSIGAFLIPVMKKSGYSGELSVAVTVTSACQGVIIPPSQIMIVYAIAAGGVSVGKMFIGGIIPGIMLGLSLMVVMYIIAVRDNIPKGRGYTLKESAGIIKDAFFGLFTVVIIMGGVFFGVCTATESAALACVYAFIVTFFIYRSVPLKQIGEILKNSLKTLAIVLSLIATANAFGWMMAYLKIPALATDILLSISDNKVVVLLLINILLLFLGCIMDMAPLILILTPILLPVVTKFGMDPIHFGVMLIFNLAIGLCTPPVGSALMVGCAVGKISIEGVVKSMLPFFAAMICVLMLITFIPELTMFLPSLAAFS